MTLFPVRLHLGHPLQVHDVGAVNAQKILRVERRFDARDGLLFQMLLAR